MRPASSRYALRRLLALCRVVVAFAAVLAVLLPAARAQACVMPSGCGCSAHTDPASPERARRPPCCQHDTDVAVAPQVDLPSSDEVPTRATVAVAKTSPAPLDACGRTVAITQRATGPPVWLVHGQLLL